MLMSLESLDEILDKISDSQMSDAELIMACIAKSYKSNLLNDFISKFILQEV